VIDPIGQQLGTISNFTCHLISVRCSCFIFIPLMENIVVRPGKKLGEMRAIRMCV
jgi:hypothetical protein